MEPGLGRERVVRLLDVRPRDPPESNNHGPSSVPEPAPSRCCTLRLPRFMSVVTGYTTAVATRAPSPVLRHAPSRQRRTVAAAGSGEGSATRCWPSQRAGRLLGATLPCVAPVLPLAALTGSPMGCRHAGPASTVAPLCVAVPVFGEPPQVPDWVVDLSPFQHLALMPAEPLPGVPCSAARRSRSPRHCQPRRPGSPRRALPHTRETGSVVNG